MSPTSELADPRSPATRFLDKHFPPERIKPLSNSWYELVRSAAVVRPDMKNPPWGAIRHRLRLLPQLLVEFAGPRESMEHRAIFETAVSKKISKNC